MVRIAGLLLWSILAFIIVFRLRTVQANYYEKIRFARSIGQQSTANHISTIPKKQSTLNDHESRFIAYKDADLNVCYLERMRNDSINTQNLWEEMLSVARHQRTLYVSDQFLTKIETWRLAGGRIVDFCQGRSMVLLQEARPIPGSSEDPFLNEIPEDENDIVQRRVADVVLTPLYDRAKREIQRERHQAVNPKLHIRLRRQAPFHGRFRGQTQSQYLNFGNGQDKEGRAEAKVTPDSSHAVVSGSNGMGQAQSMSSGGDCSDCPGYIGNIREGARLTSAGGINSGGESTRLTPYPSEVRPGSTSGSGSLDPVWSYPAGAPPGGSVAPRQYPSGGGTGRPTPTPPLGQYPLGGQTGGSARIRQNPTGQQFGGLIPPGQYSPGIQPGSQVQPYQFPSGGQPGILAQPGPYPPDRQSGLPVHPSQFPPGELPGSSIQQGSRPGDFGQLGQYPSSGQTDGLTPPSGRLIESAQQGQYLAGGQPSIPVDSGQYSSNGQIQSGQFLPTGGPSSSIQPGVLGSPGQFPSGQTGHPGQYLSGAQPGGSGQYLAGAQPGGSGQHLAGAQPGGSGQHLAGAQPGGSGQYLAGAQPGGSGQYLTGAQPGGSGQYLAGAQPGGSGQYLAGAQPGGSGQHLAGAQPGGSGQYLTGAQPGGSGQYSAGAQPDGSGQYLVGAQPGGSGQYSSRGQPGGPSQYLSHGQASGSVPPGQFLPAGQPNGSAQSGQYLGSEVQSGASQQPGQLPPGQSSSPGQYPLDWQSGVPVQPSQYLPGGQPQHYPPGQQFGGSISPGQYSQGTQPGSQVHPSRFPSGGQPGSLVQPGQYPPRLQSGIPVSSNQYPLELQPGSYLRGVPGQPGQFPSGQPGSSSQYPSRGQVVGPVRPSQYQWGDQPSSSVQSGQFPPGGQTGSLEQYPSNWQPGAPVYSGQYPLAQYPPGGHTPGGQYPSGGQSGGLLQPVQFPGGGQSSGLPQLGQFSVGAPISGLKPGDQYSSGGQGTVVNPGSMNWQYPNGEYSNTPGGVNGYPIQGQYFIQQRPLDNSGQFNGQQSGQVASEQYQPGVINNVGPSGESQISSGADDDADSQASSSVQKVNSGTTASASAQGKYRQGTAQSQVSGTYSGSGSFSAQAGTNDGYRGAQTQVSGAKEGATSTAEGSGGRGKSQAQVQLHSNTGATSSGAQSSGWNHGTNSQVQTSSKGGMADAQANGEGSTSSQAQIGFQPYQNNNDEEHGNSSVFLGGGTASAQSGTYRGQSQSQLHGTFKYGISYNGAAQAGSGSGAAASRKPFNFSSSDSKLFKPFDSFAPVVISPETTLEEETPEPTTEESVVEQSTPRGNELAFAGSGQKNVYISPKTIEKTVNTYSENLQTTHSTPLYARDYTVPDTNDYNDDYNDNDDDDDYDVTPASIQSSNQDRAISYDSDGFTVNSGQPTQYQQTRVLNGGYDAHVIQDSTSGLREGDILESGQSLPGYTIPPGFRGKVLSTSGSDTKAKGEGDSQSQTITLTPGNKNITYENRAKESTAARTRSLQTPNGRSRYINNRYTHTVPSNYRRSGYTSPPDKPNYYTFTNSVAGQINGNNKNSARKYEHRYYTKSSTCGYFTFSCNIVYGSNGRTKICKPKVPTNPDGSPINC